MNMETRNHLKNGAKPKSQMSRLFINEQTMKTLGQKVILILTSLIVFGIYGCGDNRQADANKQSTQEEDMIVNLKESDFTKLDSDTTWAKAAKDSIKVDISSAEDLSNKSTLAPDNILRVEGTASISWKGTSGCCSQGTVNDQAKQAIEQWVGMQILANRPHRYYRSGMIGEVKSAHCSSKTTWDNKRSCKGSWHQPYFIEFVKQ
ncbi:hypothetical protein LJY25_05685 [Hymenobacter sp. BT175]|uniref:hypothetical protein n=1 Tax=Hymenobacter translucens TaxID=2886507 RepID=UPI001D0E6A2C|nr:hypothetical protein [Hymenobacter translucens]MCC2545928.1 hypothetical protein [Hymenobacter translucens]